MGTQDRYTKGVCENQSFYDYWIEQDPLMKELMIRNIDQAQINNNFDNPWVPTMIYLAVFGRALLKNGNTSVNRDRVVAVTLAEAIGPELPKTMFMNRERAREELRKSVSALLNSQILGRITLANSKDYVTFRATFNDQNVDLTCEGLGVWPEVIYPAEGADIPNFENAIKVLYCDKYAVEDN